MRALLLLLTVLGLGACHPCVEVCNDQATAYEACLSEWGLGWSDLGAADVDAWWERCSDDQEVWTDGLDSTRSDAEGAQCSGLRDGLRLAQTCDDRWAAMVEYGGY